MQIVHPADWEMAIACGVDEPGRCCFVDRRHTRLDIRWKPLHFAPHMDKMLDKHRARAEKRQRIETLDDLPEGWRGVLRVEEDGTFVNAGAYFPDWRLLVEAAFIWPGRRNSALEKDVLAGTGPMDEQGPTRHWQALGLDVDAPKEFDLRKNEALPGRIVWRFQPDRPKDVRLLIERYAMPEAWLRETLRDWLQEQLEPKAKVIRFEPHMVNSHRGERLISHSRIGTVAGLRGYKSVRLDVAWRCPAEGRLYHVAYTEPTRDEEVFIPEEVAIHCCRPAPVVAESS